LITFYVVAILLLLVLSGIFSGSETAVTATGRAKATALAQAGNRRASTLVSLLDDRERLISTLLLGNNIVNILAASLATDVLLRVFGDAGVVYATAIMTVLIVIFSEVVPKTVAIRQHDAIALRIAAPLRALVFLFRPLTTAIGWIVRLVLRSLRIPTSAEDVISASQQLRGIIDALGAGGDLAKHAHDMLDGVLDLEHVGVDEVMTHRRRVVALDAEMSVREAVAKIKDESFSRYPVYRGSSDQIVGILHLRDLLASLAVEAVPPVAAQHPEPTIGDVMREPWFVPETTPLRKQLEQFRQKKMHMALVVDEYGDLQGLVTLQDVLEAIVGEVSEAEDRELDDVERQPDGSLLASGQTQIRRLNRLMDWDLPEDEAVTLAGLVIDLAERIPNEGETVHLGRYRITVRKRDRHRLSMLQISSREPVTLPE
jgi:Mg2+/Co2+ transporter CorB